MFRTLLERVCRDRVVRRKLPNGKRIYVSPDAQLKYLKRKFDTDLTKLASAHVQSNDIVWDVGANCGTFALSCHLAKTVIAVEPDPFLASLIQRSSAPNVMVLCAAISDQVGVAELSIAHRGRASNYLTNAKGRDMAGGARQTILVPTLTMDEMTKQFGLPTFIKIDIEGSEVDALRGAEKTLCSSPKLYIEVGDATRGDVLAKLDKRYDVAGAKNLLCIPL